MLKKNFQILAIFFVALAMGACATVQTVLDTAQGMSGTTPLTETEVVKGLKSALSVGTDKSVNLLSASNGYFKDEAVKILMPTEVQKVLDASKGIPLVEGLVDDFKGKFTESINRSAEDAAKSAAPILKSAVTGMTVKDAFGILKGTDTAATSYLRKTTYNNLVGAFKPKINESLDKPLLANESSNKIWSTFVTSYNKKANSGLGKIAGIKPVTNTDLSGYVTQKALNGLFLKVAGEEQKIRKDPLARVNDILKRVFGADK